MEGEFRHINLAEITPNPMNPRKRYKGAAFDELVLSISEKGVIEPIVVRPAKVGFQIVAGERRFKASIIAAQKNGGKESATIPAIIRNYNDDDVFDVMVIENLHREDLSPLEQARCFKKYLDKKGHEALPELAERTGINICYIRRRIRVLTLPKEILKDWDDETLLYGHLEQFMRLDSKDEILNFYEELKDHWGGLPTVKELRDRINNRSPQLEWALFDREAAGCTICNFNSDIQLTLFATDNGVDDAICTNAPCFKAKQAEWLTANWKKTGTYKQNKTTGFRFNDDVQHDMYNVQHNPKKVCKTCQSFLTVIGLDGKGRFPSMACFGDEECFKTKENLQDGESGNAAKGPPDWHGTYFREKFYRQRIPEVTADLTFDEKIQRVLLLSVLHSNAEARDTFLKHHCGKKGWFRNYQIFEEIKGMSPDDVRAELKTAAISILLQENMGSAARHHAGAFFGIELEKEWTMDEEYLGKKTIKEILSLGESLGIFAEPTVKAYLEETLIKKQGRFDTCKKSELIDCILKSGVDLTGRLPEEITVKKGGKDNGE